MHDAHMRAVGWSGRVDGGTQVNMFEQFSHVPGAPTSRFVFHFHLLATGFVAYPVRVCECSGSGLYPWSHLDVYHRPTVPPSLRMYAAAREQALSRRPRPDGTIFPHLVVDKRVWLTFCLDRRRAVTSCFGQESRFRSSACVSTKYVSFLLYRALISY
jgi:hypothetical protein